MRNQTTSRWAFPAACAIAALIVVYRPHCILPGFAPVDWLAQRGVPWDIANLFDPLVMIAAAVIGAGSAFGFGDLRRTLGLDHGFRQALACTAIAWLPATIVTWSAGGFRSPDEDWSITDTLLSCIPHTVVVFGMLLVIPARLCNKWFWPTALLSGVVVAVLSTLVRSDHDGAVDMTITEYRVLILGMAVGGFLLHLWHCWLVRAFGWGLWVLVLFGAAMSAYMPFTDDSSPVIQTSMWHVSPILIMTLLAALESRRRRRDAARRVRPLPDPTN